MQHNIQFKIQKDILKWLINLIIFSLHMKYFLTGRFSFPDRKCVVEKPFLTSTGTGLNPSLLKTMFVQRTALQAQDTCHHTALRHLNPRLKWLQTIFSATSKVKQKDTHLTFKYMSVSCFLQCVTAVWTRWELKLYKCLTSENKPSGC